MTIEVGTPCPAEIIENHLDLIDYEKRPGVSTFGVCCVCGYAQFIQTVSYDLAENAEPTIPQSTNGTKFIWSDSSKCPKCADVWRRNPELFIWTNQVLKIALLGRK